MIDKAFSKLGELPRKAKLLILLSLDFMVLTFSYCMSAYLSMNLVDAIDFEINYLHYLGVVVFCLASFIFLGLYKVATRFVSFRILLLVLYISVLSILFFYTFAKVLSLEAYNISAAVMYGLVVYITLSGSRFIISAYHTMRFDRLKTRVLIYGAGAAGRQLAETTANGHEYHAVAFIDDKPDLHGVVVRGLKVYPPSELESVINKYSVDRVLLALPSIGITHRKEILTDLQKYNIPVMTIPGLKDIVEGKMKIDEFQNVSIEDLLGRDPVPPNEALLHQDIQGKVVMVTGAGGSIGSELCRQIIRLNPKQIVLFESSEFALYAIGMELQQAIRNKGLEIPVRQVLGTVQDKLKVDSVLKAFGVETIYHAAAYKHVPLVEFNINEGIRNNILGTMCVAQAAITAGVEQFVLISTDKAVRPTNVMGATKRFSELVLQALATEQSKTRFTMVRFGNVLGSSGSVIPHFEKQIREGGPVTVTHKDITRYFMTIPEAAQLVIQAGAMGKGGDVFVLDMGEPVKIVDLAINLIKLMGLQIKNQENPHGDIEIIYSGLRPGEKLYEELLIGDNVGETEHPRIMTAKEKSLPWNKLNGLITELMKACDAGDQEKVREILLKAPADYQPSSEIVDYLWRSKNSSVLH
jgi:FlaA1/EpsC-like NDP-sugar epimerase